jgi:hypothetical protein
MPSKNLLKKNLKKKQPRKSNMKNVYLVLIGLLATSCATVGAVIEGGKNIATTTIDTTVKTAGSISGAALKDVSYAVSTVAETYDGVITTVVENIDKQTDELQDKPEDK